MKKKKLVFVVTLAAASEERARWIKHLDREGALDATLYLASNLSSSLSPAT